MTRDKIRTRKRILDSVGQVLMQSGMEKVGINAIARKAGIDKVLIYRYFGSLDQLLHAYSGDIDLWPTLSELIGKDLSVRRNTDVREILSRFLINQLNEIRRRKATKEVLRGGLFSMNALTKAMDNLREKQKTDFLSKLPVSEERYSHLDLEALLAFMNAAISFLVLRSRTSDQYQGIDLHSNFGWNRVEKLVRNLVSSYLDSAPGVLPK